MGLLDSDGPAPAPRTNSVDALVSQIVGSPVNLTPPTRAPARPVSRSGATRTSTGNTTLDSYLAGLRRHESGGRYNAKNPTSTASGAYQYLDSTWNNYKGYRRASDAPPAVQDERAAMDTRAAFKRYGGDWEKVAAAHFAGAGWVAKNPDKSKWGVNPVPGSNNPAVAAFVRSVLGGGGSTGSTGGSGGRVGMGASAGSGGTGSGGYALGPDGKPDAAKAIASYGYIAELANTVPDIKRVLTEAIKNGWEPEIFAANIRKTAWWRKTSESQRSADILKATNPAEFNRKLQQIADSIVIRSRQLGIPQNNPKIKKMAELALRMGWSGEEINRYVAADVKVQATGNKGATAVTVDMLKEQAKQYLVPISDATMQTWTSQILKGDVSPDAFESYLKEQAKSLWPTLGNAIDSGVTVAQYVEPYRQLAAQTLEINPDDVDFMQPKWSQALFQLNKDGARGAMSLADWGQSLRKRTEYRSTKAANEQVAAATNYVTEMFGKVAR